MCDYYACSIVSAKPKYASGANKYIHVMISVHNTHHQTLGEPLLAKTNRHKINELSQTIRSNNSFAMILSANQQGGGLNSRKQECDFDLSLSSPFYYIVYCLPSCLISFPLFALLFDFFRRKVLLC